jgi:hypothetical protein
VDFVAVVDQAIALRRQRGRLTYRTLQVLFQLALIWDSGGLCSHRVRASQRMLKAIDNERLYEGECDKRRGGRPRHIHAPGIRQAPRAESGGHATDMQDPDGHTIALVQHPLELKNSQATRRHGDGPAP